MCNDDYLSETGIVAPHVGLVWPNERRSLREKWVPYFPPCALEGPGNIRAQTPMYLGQWRHWAMTKAVYGLLQIINPC